MQVIAFDAGQDWSNFPGGFGWIILGALLVLIAAPIALVGWLMWLDVRARRSTPKRRERS